MRGRTGTDAGFRRTFLCALLLTSAASAGHLSAHAGASTVVLNGLEIGIDETCGSIVRLSHPATGVVLAAESSSGSLLEVVCSTNGGPDLHLASRYSTARLVSKPNAVTIRWPRLLPSDNADLPTVEIAAQVEIKSAPDGKSVILTCEVDGKCPDARITNVVFPDLSGLKRIAGDSTRLRFPVGEVYPFRSPDGKTIEYLPGGINMPNCLRWLDYGGKQCGVSVFLKKWGVPEWPVVITSTQDRNNLRLAWRQTCSITTGQTWTSGEYYLTPHRGGWAKGIETFREYAGLMNSTHDLPPQVRDDIGFRTIWMKQQCEVDPAKAAFRFRDIPAVAQESAEHGLHDLSCWGWSIGFNLPIVVEKSLGTRQELIDAIHQSRAKGVNVAPFISIQHMRYTERYGVPMGTPSWIYDPEFVPDFLPYYIYESPLIEGYESVLMDSNNKLWLAALRGSLTDWIKRGLTSFGYDEFYPRYNGGSKPRLVSLMEGVRQLARSKVPNSTLAGESINESRLELMTSVMDYTWNWMMYIDAGPVMNVLRAPRLNCNIESSPMTVKMAFCDGLYMNVFCSKPGQPNGTAWIREKPALSAALKEVAARRRQFLPYFVDGVFLGDSVLSNIASGHVVGYQLANKLFIVVLNNQSTPEQVNLECDLDMWIPGDDYEVKYYDSTGAERWISQWTRGAKWTGTTALLQPLELAYLTIMVKKPQSSAILTGKVTSGSGAVTGADIEVQNRSARTDGQGVYRGPNVLNFEVQPKGLPTRVRIRRN